MQVGLKVDRTAENGKVEGRKDPGPDPPSPHLSGKGSPIIIKVKKDWFSVRRGFHYSRKVVFSPFFPPD